MYESCSCQNKVVFFFNLNFSSWTYSTILVSRVEFNDLSLTFDTQCSNRVFFYTTLRLVILYPFNRRVNGVSKKFVNSYCRGFHHLTLSSDHRLEQTYPLLLRPRKCVSWVFLRTDTLQIFGSRFPRKYASVCDSNDHDFFGGKYKFWALCIKILSICPLKLYAS